MPPWFLSDLVAPDTIITIADIGASYLEPPPYDALVKQRIARIIGFEPNEEECTKLKQMFGPPHNFYPQFVGRGGEATFHETSWVYTGSLLKPNKKVGHAFNGLWETMVPVAEHKVTTVALDDLLQGQTVDYIKIDVQGGELAVFEGAEKLLDNVLAIHTEVEFAEMYEGQPLFADVDQFLRRHGFGLVKFIGMRSGALRPCVLGGNINLGNHLLWSDALYVKDILALEKLADDQLIKLAAICHDVYEMSDFGYRILMEYDERKGTAFARQYIGRFS